MTLNSEHPQQFFWPKPQFINTFSGITED